MNTDTLRAILEAVSQGETTPGEAMDKLKAWPFEDVGFAKVDHHRVLRQGIPEAIFGAGKTPEQLVEISRRIKEQGVNVLATRCTGAGLHAVKAAFPEAVINEAARTATITLTEPKRRPGYVGVVCAGTSDIDVAEEAIVTLESQGSEGRRIYDVGVAGIHRLLAQREVLQGAVCLIVCAGMEGALPSVVAGLVDIPVIAVPTSVGYGANFGGVAALLAMLNSCGTGVSVCNIDNGFGAAMLAAMIHRLACGEHRASRSEREEQRQEA